MWWVKGWGSYIERPIYSIFDNYSLIHQHNKMQNCFTVQHVNFVFGQSGLVLGLTSLTGAGVCLHTFICSVALPIPNTRRKSNCTNPLFYRNCHLLVGPVLKYRFATIHRLGERDGRTGIIVRPRFVDGGRLIVVSLRRYEYCMVSNTSVGRVS